MNYHALENGGSGFFGNILIKRKTLNKLNCALF